ncbi:MAG: glucosidase [Planctomycetaceae bacterium]|nr:glucosidase [Planctomycetaceae bacterium]
MSHASATTAEHHRMRDEAAGLAPWRFWGPYVSCRQWGTVREDYSTDGSAWDSFPHDHARSRAYRWGEDGIAGWCDKNQRLCLTLALWNGRDPILKERFFGLTNSEGNHGEDAKEIWWHEDALPSHAWNRMGYAYPQREFPYATLVEENRRRTRLDGEFELLDTGVLDDDRFFEVWATYAKRGHDETVLRIEIVNRGPERAELHVLPQLAFRNTWSWREGSERPLVERTGPRTVRATCAALGAMELRLPSSLDAPELLFCENETNAVRHFGADPAEVARDRRPKDAFHDRVVHGDEGAVNAVPRGTKAAAWYRIALDAGARISIDLVLCPSTSELRPEQAPQVLADRRREADEYYAYIQRGIESPEARRVQRQAYAGLLWSKQYYEFDVRRWIDGDPTQPEPPDARRTGRNAQWRHLAASSVLSMPDTWEYPWFAAWDLAFHCVAIANIDAAFAKGQLSKLLTDHYMHPSGELPAYEWAFSDVNPPIHAWAAWRTYLIDKRRHGTADHDFLASVFNRLLLNFTWWVNRKDSFGRNIFEGGFLGLDNVGVFDRSQPLPGGGRLQQADGTSWMAMFALTMMRMALELAHERPFYQDMAAKFFEHFLQIAEAMTQMGGKGVGLWNEEDGFYYDMMHLPDGRIEPIKVLSVVGLIPLFAVETIEPELLERMPVFRERLEWFLRERPEMAALVSRWNEPGRGERRLLSLLRGHRMKCLLRKALDERHFLSPFGVRSLSRELADRPYTLWIDGKSYSVRYEPAESQSGLFGGNSNWRGPIWMPMNLLLVESLQKFHHYYGDDFRIDCPVGSATKVTLLEAADEISRRATRLFMPGAEGVRPSTAMHPKFAQDPTLRQFAGFYEYFDGDTGRGCGASHQTGWTACIAKLMTPRGQDERHA